MMTLTQQIITIAAVVLATMVTRFLPFLDFSIGKTDPKVYPVSWKSSPCCSVWTADRLLLKKCKYLFWQPRNP